jgi:hypothetical protein
LYEFADNFPPAGGNSRTKMRLVSKNELKKPEGGITSIQQNQIAFTEVFAVVGCHFPFSATLGSDERMGGDPVQWIEHLRNSGHGHGISLARMKGAEVIRDLGEVRQLYSGAINGLQEETVPSQGAEFLHEMINGMVVENSEGFMLEFLSGVAVRGFGNKLRGNRRAGENFEELIELGLVGTSQKIAEVKNEGNQWQFPVSYEVRWFLARLFEKSLRVNDFLKKNNQVGTHMATHDPCQQSDRL